MRNAVRFTCRAFNTTEPRAYFINPCCFGDDLGAWLRPRLEARGYRVSGPDQEDWGWYLVCARDGREVLIAVGAVDGSEGEWLIHLVPHRSLADRLLGRARDAGELARDLHAVLAGAAEVDALEWLALDVRGRESDRSGRP